MTVTLYVAPTGHGKTRFAVDLVRRTARGLQACPRVCVANRQQRVSWQRRLSAAPGCIGAHLLTFDDLHAACLVSSGVRYTRIGDVVQYRLLRAVAASLPLTHYAAVRDFPGFIQECQRVIDELKSTQIAPDSFLYAVRQVGDPPRLREIGQIYAHYQQHLQEHHLVDRRGLGWLALEALANDEAPGLQEWDLLLLDGFASFTQTQLSVLAALQNRIPQIVITLTGEDDTGVPRTAYRQFVRTRHLLIEKLDVELGQLPESAKTSDFSKKSDDNVSLATVPDHAAEVRVALRWLKERIQVDGVPPNETALTARDLVPYRPYILQIAEEFGLPVYFVDGPSLQENPCIAALLALLRLLLPAESAPDTDATILPRRAFISTLRSPYFDWRSLTAPSAPTGVQPLDREDIERLDVVGRWGNVSTGAASLRQWTETLRRLAQLPEPAAADDAYDQEVGAAPTFLPRAKQAAELHEKLLLCLQRLQPPEGRHSVSHFVRWLEDLIGPDFDENQEESSPSLNMLACVRQADPLIRNRDLVALRQFKDVLRGLIWAEQVGLLRESLDYNRFYEEVAGAVEAATYRPGSHDERQAILVSNVVQGRGVPCHSLAIMGLSEGLFPATLGEDPILTEADRATLRTEFSLPLDPAIQSFEQEYFYETVARPWARLLITRPSQAESGATWEPSPFWTEIQRLTATVDPTTPAAELTDRANHNLWPGTPPAASEAELLMHAAALGDNARKEYLRDQTHQRLIPLAPRWQQIEGAATIFTARSERSLSPFEGLLHEIEERLGLRFGPQYAWSASRLETYLSCPLHFFLAHVLGIEPRAEAVEGLDARQLGNIYHRLFEQTYRHLPPSERADPDRLKEALHQVAPDILDTAPQREGFRAPAWWPKTRQEILRNVEDSLEQLSQLDDQFVPTHFERFFGRTHPLHLERGGERIPLRGIIDRVDVDDQGRLRLIDYKTAGPYGYSRAAHRDGRRLQLPLYALAVEEALQLGSVVDGFYWHVQHAEPSSFTLQEDAPTAMQTAIEHAWQAVDGARQGHFVPQPPPGGCPNYCPGAAFCWRYTPRRSY